MNRFHLNCILIALLLGASFASYSQIIVTIAGDSTQGFSGDGGLATIAELNLPEGVVVDASMNVYLSDEYNQRVRVVNTTGIINTIAGNGYGGFSGDGGMATDAELWNPNGVALDASGNLYISDCFNNRIRIVNTSGIIHTFAGIGSYGYSGDGGPASAAELHEPIGITSDASGNVYIGDYLNSSIRTVNTSGIISTFAGNGIAGFFGDGGPATSSELYAPWGIGVDNAGNVYIADYGNDRIREVNTSGIINTIAGNGYLSKASFPPYGAYSGDGGPATAAEFYNPSDVKSDASGNIYISDFNNSRIRIANTSGIVNTFAGNGLGGYSGDGGQATAADISGTQGLALDASGNVYIGDFSDNRIRKITSITTGVSSISSGFKEINIYPSPTSGSFTITGISQGQIIEVYNYLGQKITPAFPADIAGRINSYQINIASLPNGIYLIRIQNKGGSVVATKKIVKTD